MACWLQTWMRRLGSRSCSTRSVDTSPVQARGPALPVKWPQEEAQGGGTLGWTQWGPPDLGTFQRAQEQCRCLWGRPPRAALPGPSQCAVTLSPQVLNEVVIDRGPSSYLSNVDVYLDGHLITTVQGDGRWAPGVPQGGGGAKPPESDPAACPPGVIVSTPTGSTAYAAAAGASMIHPNVPAIMITPICPHSLSFRPIVVPAGVELKVESTLYPFWFKLLPRAYMPTTPSAPGCDPSTHWVVGPALLAAGRGFSLILVCLVGRCGAETRASRSSRAVGPWEVGRVPAGWRHHSL